MTVNVDTVESMVATAGLELNRSSVSELSEQGVINRVFTASTDVGEVVIHVGKRLDQDTHSKSKPRIYGVSEILRETKIPCAEVYYYGTTADNRWFVVQERLDGQPLRNVASPRAYFDKTGEILARLHSIETGGYGFFEYQNGDLFSPHETWLSYLKQRRTESMDMIGDVLAESRRKRLEEELDQFFAEYGDLFRAVEPRFCHGDVGFGNVLVTDEVTGIIDFEWANSGDPAMDFIHDEAKELLPVYSTHREESFDVEEFEFRTSLYEIITSLGIAEIFSDDPDVVDGRVNQVENRLDELL